MEDNSTWMINVSTTAHYSAIDHEFASSCRCFGSCEFSYARNIEL